MRHIHGVGKQLDQNGEKGSFNLDQEKTESHYFLLNLQIFFMGLQIFLDRGLAGLGLNNHSTNPCTCKTKLIKLK